jgi:hypothetical protein
MRLPKDVNNEREMIDKAIANLSFQECHNTKHLFVFNGTKHM